MRNSVAFQPPTDGNGVRCGDVKSDSALWTVANTAYVQDAWRRSGMPQERCARSGSRGRDRMGAMIGRRAGRFPVKNNHRPWGKGSAPTAPYGTRKRGRDRARAALMPRAGEATNRRQGGFAKHIGQRSHLPTPGREVHRHPPKGRDLRRPAVYDSRTSCSPGSRSRRGRQLLALRWAPARPGASDTFAPSKSSTKSARRARTRSRSCSSTTTRATTVAGLAERRWKTSRTVDDLREESTEVA